VLRLIYRFKRRLLQEIGQRGVDLRGAIGEIASLKPKKVTSFTIFLYNSENNIRDIRPFCRLLFCHCSVLYFISLTVAKLLWDLTTKYYWNPPPLNLAGWIRPVCRGFTLITRMVIYQGLVPGSLLIFQNERPKLDFFFVEGVVLQSLSLEQCGS